ncbi:hypothetical protein SAMN05660826_01404 [Caldanaerovirga acetigignens]|uniref:Uncharacterized protein n=1 Tax=Caldanaerovirga acetigignens TaxID=447595 RepID=A0A1M7JZ90_9FIRM|nr:hypothetical protein [Caldanaerovirga acetigignens]SHM58284.1 hypothetical protein SAMN05660826_01404 [Caldanaerovirga acetigignens]
MGPRHLSIKIKVGNPLKPSQKNLNKKLFILKCLAPYKNANFKHFQKLLDRVKNIKLSYSALYGILTGAGIKSPKKKRRFKSHRRRKRKLQPGLLVQMDTTPFNWFGYGNGGVFSFFGKQFKSFKKENQPSIPAHTTVNVFISSITGVWVEYKGRVYETVPFVKPKKSAAGDISKEPKSPYRPPDSHYYKYSQSLFKPVTFEESDREIHEILQEIFLGKYKKFACLY